MSEKSKNFILYLIIFLTALPYLLLINLPELSSTQFPLKSLALYLSSILGFFGIVMLVWQLVLGTRSYEIYKEQVEYANAPYKDVYRQQVIYKNCAENTAINYTNLTIACSIKLINLQEENKELVLIDEALLRTFDTTQDFCINNVRQYKKSCLIDLAYDAMKLSPKANNAYLGNIYVKDIALGLEPTSIFNLSLENSSIIDGSSKHLRILALLTINLKKDLIDKGLEYDAESHLAVYQYDKVRSPENDKEYYDRLYSKIELSLKQECASTINKQIFTYCNELQ